RKLFQYPLEAIDALTKLGPAQVLKCFASYLRESIQPTDPDGSFESWVVHRFGRRLFEIFFKTYSEKLWGIPCDELDADFAAQRIKKFSLGEAIKAALGIGGGNHKTLVDQFAFPTGGTGMVYERMAQRVESLGGAVHLNAPVRRIIHF